MLGYTGMGISNHYTVTKTRMKNKRVKIEMHSLIHYYLSSPVLLIKICMVYFKMDNRKKCIYEYKSVYFLGD